jgi:flagellar biosynthesis protein FliR
VIDALALEGPVATFGLVLTRLGGLLLALPFFGGEIAPLRVRIVFAVVISGALTLATPMIRIDTSAPSIFVVALVGELVLGLFLGLVVRMTVATAELAGELAGIQMGFGFNRLVDPMLQEQVGPLTRMVSMAAGVLFFVTDAYREVIRGFAMTLAAVPPGSARISAAWAELLVERTGALFAGGLRVGGPVIFAVLGAQLSFGLLGRVAPHLNLWALGFLVTIGVGLICMALFVPSLVADVRALLEDGVGDLVAVVAR